MILGNKCDMDDKRTVSMERGELVSILEKIRNVCLKMGILKLN